MLSKVTIRWRERRLFRRCWLILATAQLALASTTFGQSEPPRTGLVGEWLLKSDAQDSSGKKRHGEAQQVTFGDGDAGATFDGKSSVVEVSQVNDLSLGAGPFTLSARIHLDSSQDDVTGDIVSKYDPQSRTGILLTVKHNVGGTTSQANYRQLEFTVTDGRQPTWSDCGRPGNAVLIYALAVHDGSLFAGTCVAGEQETGRVFRYVGGQQWDDCGSPDKCNAVSAFAVLDGSLYAATSKYRLRGSSLDESENPNLGGKIFRYDGDSQWTCVGTLPGIEAINGLAVYKNRLYASSTYAPSGFFRYDGENRWVDLGTPEGKRVEAMCVFDGHLFAGGYDQGAVYRFDGSNWHHCGIVGDNTQTYGFAVFASDLYVGTWPTGKAYRYLGDNNWLDAGRLGEELEVMGMAVYGGEMYAGSLPLAEVYRYRPENRWDLVGRVDHTPDVKYRRAWTMANHAGKLFVGTLPSGHVWALDNLSTVTVDSPLSPGSHAIAAVRDGSRISLYIDGKLAAERTLPGPSADVTNSSPLKIGLGQHDHFNGRIGDVRLYQRALTAEELK